MKLLDILLENYNNTPIIGMRMVDGELLIKYKDLNGDVVDDSYDQFTEDYGARYIRDYFITKNLTLGNSGVVRWVIREDPKNEEWNGFFRDENGRLHPEYFIGNYKHWYRGDKDERNRMIRRIRNVLNLIYDSQYPMVVYRGLNVDNPKYSEKPHKGNYWSLKKRVAEGFGGDVYVGLIKSPEDISIVQTVQNRMTWPEEYEVYVKNPENVEIVQQLKRK